MHVTDPRDTYDAWRAEPLARDGSGRPVLCRHADVVAAASDPATYSSAVSRFLQVPNGLDGAEHGAARDLLDPFFGPDRMAELEPVIARVAAEVVAALPSEVDAVLDLGARFAVRAQSAWLGWPAELEPELLGWMADNHSANRSGELVRTREVAERFDAIIRSLLDARRESPQADVTTELVRLQDAAGEPRAPHPSSRRMPGSADDSFTLSEEALVSVLRNWTGGDLGSLALCTGVVAHWLVSHPEHQDELLAADDAALDAAIDEILRIDDPFVSNRRLTTRDTAIGGQPIAAGERVVLNWTAANRDPAVFGDPDHYDPVGNAPHNLVYGIGPHVCPGRPLATLELRLLVRALLSAARLEPSEQRAERELPPLGGFSEVPVRLVRR